MILGISTSLSQFCVTLNDDGSLVYCDRSNRESDGQSSIYEQVYNALKYKGIGTGDITNIVVDIGPGGTSSVRTGVSFANGLSYSLKIPIIGISSAELIGIEAFKMYNQTTAVLFKSIKKNFYCGFYDGKKMYFHYSNIVDISRHIIDRFSSIVLAGNLEAIYSLEELLGARDVIKSKLHKVNPYVLGEYSPLFASNAKDCPSLPTPITETNLLKWNQDS